ncbi:hypothetical protein HHI36_020129, partial [Cryptolaemus montrouzieri]
RASAVAIRYVWIEHLTMHKGLRLYYNGVARNINREKEMGSYKNIKSGVVSYEAPEGSDLSQGLYDSSYDGQKSEARLINGLGRLVDGEIGADNFRLDIGYGKGNGWVAWKNDSFPGFVDLLFAFDQLRNFSSVNLYTNNFFSKGVQVFSKAKLIFSVGGLFYNGPTLSFSYMPDNVLENARNVSINLKGRIGRFIKMRLFFADRWIMLSEVTFESGKFISTHSS